MSWDQATIDGLRDCPRESLPFAALGYRAGVHDERERWESAIGRAGEAVAGASAGALKRPSHADLESRRTLDFSPCPVRCGRCSRCVCALARERRGGRDFLGVEQERRTTKSDHDFVREALA